MAFDVVVHQPAEQLLIGDAQRIQQILANLLSNGIKFTEQGSISLEVELSPQQVQFVITDTGIGIAEKSLPHLFKPFEQADSSITRRFGGTGLGLSISQSLATYMGGTLEVESEEGHGSRFTLMLPLQWSKQRVDEVGQVPEPVAATYFSGRVLVAEDTPEIQALLTHMLRQMGVEVILAVNGQEAVEQALQQQMTLILMDMQMPIMDGIEATRMLRSTFYSGPIVALTANVMADHRKKFEEAGANGFLTKPIEKQALLEVLGQYLEVVEQPEATAEPEAVINGEALDIFRSELAKNANQLRDALYIDNLATVQQIAHKFKGAAASFGYEALRQLGKQVCDAHHQEEYEQVRQLTNRMLMLALEISNEEEEDPNAITA